MLFLEVWRESISDLVMETGWSEDCCDEFGQIEEFDQEPLLFGSKNPTSSSQSVRLDTKPDALGFVHFDQCTEGGSEVSPAHC